VKNMTETNDVYNAFRHILENYDGITSAVIDYDNLSAERNYWKVGRQLTQQKKSSEYLTSLAKQTFTGIYPTRAGKRGLKAWFEDTTSVATHDETKIIKILKYEKSPISKVYNDITLNYDWNPGLKKFNKSMFITKTDDPGDLGFPDIHESTGTDTDRSSTWTSTFTWKNTETEWIAHHVFNADPTSWLSVGNYLTLIGDNGYIISFSYVNNIKQDGSDWVAVCKYDNQFGITNGATCSSGTIYQNSTAIPLWTTYMGGLNDYVTGKAWWEICHASYDRSLTVNPLPRELGDCYWFIDNEDFETGTGGSGNAVYYYMQLLVLWATRQKDVVEYTIPINAANVQRELMEYITFNDAIYTNGSDRNGWITKIKHIPGKHIFIEAVLIPTDISEINLIIETGSQPDTIIESGSQTDTYTEGAQ